MNSTELRTFVLCCAIARVFLFIVFLSELFEHGAQTFSRADHIRWSERGKFLLRLCAAEGAQQPVVGGHVVLAPQ